MLSLSTIISIISAVGPDLPQIEAVCRMIFNDVAHGEGGIAKIEKVIADLETLAKTVGTASAIAQSVQQQNMQGNGVDAPGATAGA